jgi:hypothetical protein
VRCYPLKETNWAVKLDLMQEKCSGRLHYVWGTNMALVHERLLKIAEVLDSLVLLQ